MEMSFGRLLKTRVTYSYFTGIPGKARVEGDHRGN